MKTVWKDYNKGYVEGIRRSWDISSREKINHLNVPAAFPRGNRPLCFFGWVGGRDPERSLTWQPKEESMLLSGIEIRCQSLPWQSYPTLLRRDSKDCNSLKFDTQNRRCNVVNQLMWFPHLHNVNCQETNQGGEVTVKLLFYPNPLCSNRSIRGP